MSPNNEQGTRRPERETGEIPRRQNLFEFLQGSPIAAAIAAGELSDNAFERVQDFGRDIDLSDFDDALTQVASGGNRPSGARKLFRRVPLGNVRCSSTASSGLISCF